MSVDRVSTRHSQWLKGVLDLCVLGLLARGEQYGYEIAKQLEVHGLGRINGGTLYPLLARLESESLVSGKWKPSEQGPERKYYALTVEGMELLQAAAPLWREFAGRAQGVMGGGR
jgi:PadR family transcriptional regulator PadR